VARDKQASDANALDIVNTDAEECPLELSWRWGDVAVNHVLFNDHHGPYKGIVEPGGKGVKVSFDGWGKEPFKASANKQIRITSRVAGRQEIEFMVELVSAREIRIRSAARQSVRGSRIAIAFGCRDEKGVPMMIDAERPN
jgi:hypothetical protein